MRSLVAGLPPGSATWRAQTGETDYWSRTEQLLAAAIDWLGVLNYNLVAVMGGKPPERPKPVYDPAGEAAEGERTGRAVPLYKLLQRLPGIEGEERPVIDVEAAEATRGR